MKMKSILTWFHFIHRKSDIKELTWLKNNDREPKYGYNKLPCNIVTCHWVSEVWNKMCVETRY